MKIEIEVSELQHAAFAAVAQKLRLGIEETAKVLAFITINTNFDKDQFRDMVDDVRETLADGGYALNPGSKFCDWIDMPTSAGLDAALQKPVTVEFTAPQIERLRAAAAVIGNGVTVEEIVVTGALSALDMSASSLEDGVGALVGIVESYARDRVAFVDPEYGAHPLQSAYAEEVRHG